jgi:hypothetical protein
MAQLVWVAERVESGDVLAVDRQRDALEAVLEMPVAPMCRAPTQGGGPARPGPETLNAQSSPVRYV